MCKVSHFNFIHKQQKLIAMQFKVKEEQEGLVQISMTGLELEKMMSTSDELVQVLTKRLCGHTMNEEVVYISFFLSVMSRLFSKMATDKNGNIIMKEPEWTDMIASQAKFWGRQIKDDDKEV